MPTTILQGKKLSTVDLNWKQVFYTNCGMVSASNVDQELGWCKTDFTAIGVDYSYFLSRRENDWYPHYIHNLDNLIRFGGLYPPIHVEADIRRTRLLGATPTYEGGCMLVRAKDPIYKMSHLKGKRIGLSKSLNTLKNDWWRITEHYGILNMLMLNDMSIEDVEIVEFPDADDWYSDPKMLRASEQRDRALHGEDGPQAHPDHPPVGDGAAGRQGRCDLHPQQDLAAPAGRHRQDRGDRGPVALPGLAAAGQQRAGDHHLQRRDGRGASRARRHVPEGHDQGGALGQRAQARGGGDPGPPDLLPRRRGHLPEHQAHRHGAEPRRRRTWRRSRSARTSCCGTATSSATSTCSSGLRPSSSSRRPRD